MKSISWRVKLGAALLATALALFGIHYLVFRDFHHLAVFTVHDIAFLPVEVLIVTMILHELLERRARREKMHKLNMVIGAFFSEAGSELLRPAPPPCSPSSGSSTRGTSRIPTPTSSRSPCGATRSTPRHGSRSRSAPPDAAAVALPPAPPGR